MKREEFVVGQYYRITHRTGWIIQFDGFEGDTMLSDSSMTLDGSWYRGPRWGSFKSSQENGPARLATADEIRHLQACTALGRWVEKPKNEILTEYSIY